MNLLDYIPIGKQHKETRETLMNKANITNIKLFKKEINKLRKRYIVIFNNGYYLPANKEEYQEFIQKLNMQAYDINKTIDLAYKEMKEKC